MIRFENINPCLSCDGKDCGSTDGCECKKCNDYFSLKKEFASLKKELDITRQYIHDNGLEWDFMSKFEKYTDANKRQI